MDMHDLIVVAAEVIAGASVLSLGLAKVFPKFGKFGPFLTGIAKVLKLLALNHKDRQDPGPVKPAVGKVKVLRDPKTGKVVGFRRPK